MAGNFNNSAEPLSSLRMATDELSFVQRSEEIQKFIATAQTQVASAGEAFTGVEAALTAYFTPQSSKEKLFDCGCSNCAHAHHNQLHVVGEQLIIKLNRFYTEDDKAVKHTHKIEHSPLLHLGRYCKKEQQPCNLILCGIIAHEGPDIEARDYTGTFKFGKNLRKQIRNGTCCTKLNAQALTQEKHVYMLIYKHAPIDRDPCEALQLQTAPPDEACNRAHTASTLRSQVQPSVRLMYLYIQDLAGSAARLDPQGRPGTADTEKWVPPSRKRAHGAISGHLVSDDNHDADESDNTTGSATDGPAHYTRSQASAAVPKARQAADSTGTMQPQHKQKDMAGPAKILCQMPQVSRSSLHLADAISFRHACEVRHGTWQGTPAVYKVWDLGDSLEPMLDMQAELDAYQTLNPLQGVHIPRLLGHGQIHASLHAFTAMSAGGSPWSPDMLRRSPAFEVHGAALGV